MLTYTVEQEDKLFADYAAHPDKIVINPIVDGRIVGMMTFEPGARRKSAHQGEFGMSIHPDFQGQGIGAHMLTALIEWAESNPGHQKAWLLRRRRHHGSRSS